MIFQRYQAKSKKNKLDKRSKKLNVKVRCSLCHRSFISTSPTRDVCTHCKLSSEFYNYMEWLPDYEF